MGFSGLGMHGKARGRKRQSDEKIATTMHGSGYSETRVLVISKK
jgi:hypothetical protein